MNSSNKMDKLVLLVNGGINQEYNPLALDCDISIFMQCFIVNALK